MSEGKITVTGFKKSYGCLDLDTFKNDNEKYNDMLGLIEIDEFNHGFKIKKVFKATKRGTSINFAAVETEEECKSLRDDILKRHGKLIKS